MACSKRDSDIGAALDAILERVDGMLDIMDERFPYFYERTSDTWVTTNDGNWCGGHWIGLLWLAHEYAESSEESARFERAADSLTRTMTESMQSNAMFFGMNHHYVDFRAHDITGDRSRYALGLESADAMIDNFDERARQIPLGELDVKGPSEQFRGPRSNHGPSGATIGAVDNVYTTRVVASL